MPNPTPKGSEYMRKLGRAGAVKSAGTRRRKVGRNEFLKSMGMDPIPAALLKAKRPNVSGGSHDTDWACPKCRHRNTIKRRMCAKCKHSPANGRLTRKALKIRAEEHRTQASLRKFAIPECGEGDIEYVPPPADPLISPAPY